MAPTRAIVLVPGVGMFTFGKDKQTARVAGEFYVNAINVMRGAEGALDLRPDRRGREVPHRVLGAGGGQARGGCRSPSRSPTRVALVTGAASGIGKAIAERLAAEGACVVVADLALERRRRLPRRSAAPTWPSAWPPTSADEDAVQAMVDAAALAFGGVDLVVNNAGLSLSKSLLETTADDWDLQHDVMAKGSFLVSRAAARALIDQGLGGDIVYISSKNSVFAGPNNVAYSARPRPTRPTRCGCWRPSSASTASRSTASTPTASSRAPASSPSGWGANRAAVYGVPEEDLGEFYAQRTLLKREVLPEHIANAVFALSAPT